MTVPVFTEQWVNPPQVKTTVPAGAPAVPGGTSQLWTMAGGYGEFRTADPTALPPSMFRVYDPADPREIIVVTDTRAAPAWRVTRGDQRPGTVVDHKPGFQVIPFLTADAFGAKAEGTASRTGLIGNVNRIGPLAITAQNVRTTVASLPVPGGEGIFGSVYQATAFGFFDPAGATGTFDCGLEWGSASPGSVSFRWDGAVANSRWRITASLNLYPRTDLITSIGSSTIHLHLATANNASTPITSTMFGPDSEFVLNTTDPQTFRLWVTKPWAGGQIVVLSAGVGRAA